MSKTNKLLLGLGLVAVVAIPLTIVSCGPNEEKPPIVDPEKPIPPIEPPVLGDVLTKEIADEFFANGGKWNEKKTLVASDFKGFSSVSDYALSGRQLTSVVLSNEIISIGDHAFFNNGITHFTFGQNLEHIGDHAFSHNDLTKIVLPSKLKTLGESAFVTNFINSINIPSSLKIISNNAFAGNPITAIIIPNSITHIGAGAFDATALTSLHIPDSVISIGDGAFANNPWTASSSITLPSQFDNPTERQRIGLPFEEVIVPEPIINLELSAKTSVGTIEENEVSHLNEVDQDINNKSLLLIKKLFNIQDANDQNLIDGLKIKILSSGLNKTVWLATNEGFKINGDLTEIDSVSFVINVPPIDPPVSGDVLTREITDGFFANGGKWNGKKTLVASDFEGFTSIGDGAFYNKQITSVVLSNEITSIGDHAFNDTNLQKFVFSTTLTHIGENAFKYNEIKEMILPSTLKTMGKSAFENSLFLNEIIIPSSLTMIPDRAFANSASKKITLHNSLTHIGEMAFEGNQLTAVTIPNSVISIGSRAFAVNFISVLPSLPNGIPVGDIFDEQHPLKINQVKTYFTRFNKVKKLI